MSHKKFILFGLLFCCGFVHAQKLRVLKVSNSQKFVAISQLENDTWKIDEEVCFFKKSKEVACGKISKSLKSTAVVEVSRSKEPIDEFCEIRSSTRKLASSIEESADGVHKPLYRNEIGGGLIGAISLYFPMITYQHGFGRHWALGLSPSFLNVSTSSTISLFSVAALATFNYYFKDDYRGIWIQAGAGPHFYMIKSTSPAATENKIAVTGIATLGWKGSWDLGLNIGVAIGGIYISSPVSTIATISFLSVQPVGLVNIGFNF